MQKQGHRCRAAGFGDCRAQQVQRIALAEVAVGHLTGRRNAALIAPYRMVANESRRSPAASDFVVRSQEGRTIVNIATDDGPLPETGDDPRDQIAYLEARLEELADAWARCRKIRLISQIAIAAGGVWMLAVAIGVLGVDPMAMMAAISGVIGGTVVYGSNRTTWREIDAAINDAEAKRAALIGRLKLRVVREGEHGTV
jgi:hypothetical protein